MNTTLKVSMLSITPLVVVFELKPKMYHTQGEHAIHYTTGGCT
jgi:hypothetical protein